MKIMTSSTPPKILIVGGGYLGLYVAWNLERYRTPLDVTIVEPNGFMTYQPLLPEVAGGHVDPSDVKVELSRVLKHARIITGSLVSLDSTAKTAEISVDGETSTEHYDHVVLALGAITRTFPTPGLKENAVGFKSIDDAVYARNRVLESIELAASTTDDAERQKALTFVFVGAGYTGVEALAELSDVSKVAIAEHPNLSKEQLRWVLVEALDRVAPEVGPDLSVWSLGQLRSRGIDVKLKTTMKSCIDGNVVLSTDETFPARTIVWTAGVTPSPVLDETGMPRGPKGHVSANAKLQVVTDAGDVIDGAWAAGDNAQVPDLTAAKQPAYYPPNAQNAVRQATVLAGNIVAVVTGRTPREYRHRSLGTIASYGVGRGAANIFQKLKLKNLPAWLAHRSYHGLAVPTLDNKKRIISGWLLNPLNWQDLRVHSSGPKPKI